MSVWSTRLLDRDGEFVIIKHGIRGINYNVKGVRFRDGYAVVEKGSKTYFDLKKIPQLKNAIEYDILHLRELPFITRTLDIQQIFGRDVYLRYLDRLEYSKTEEFKKLQKKEEIIAQKKEEEHIEEGLKCRYRLSTGKLCQNDAEDLSPSKYCKIHLLEDRKLSDFGIKIPLAIPKQQKKKLREKVLNKLKALLKEEPNGSLENKV